MKMNTFYRFRLVAAVSLPILIGPAPFTLHAASQPSQPSNERILPPDTAEVLNLARSGVSDDVVLAYIKKSPRTFDLSDDDVVYLKRSGLSGSLVDAMQQHDTALRMQRLIAPKPDKRPRRPAEPPPAVVVVPPGPPNSEERLTIPPAPQPRELTPAFPSKEPKKPAAPKKPRAWTSSLIVDQAPPPPKLEIQPLPPGSDHVWVPGHWTWHDSSWTWLRGEWIERPVPGMVWVDGHWAKHGRGYIWVPGHWRT